RSGARAQAVDGPKGFIKSFQASVSCGVQKRNSLIYTRALQLIGSPSEGTPTLKYISWRHSMKAFAWSTEQRCKKASDDSGSPNDVEFSADEPARHLAVRLLLHGLNCSRANHGSAYHNRAGPRAPMAMGVP